MKTIITARLDEQTHQRLKDLARREDRSVSWLIRRAVEQFVEPREESHGRDDRDR